MLMSVMLFAVMWAVLVATGRPRAVMLAATVFGLINVLLAINATLGAVLQGVSRVNQAATANVATKIVWGVGLLIGLHYDASLAVLALPGLAGESLRAVVLVPAARREADLRYRIDVAAVRAALLESVPYFVNSLALGVLGSLSISTLEFIRVDEREVGWFAASQNVAYLCMLLSPLIFWVVMPLLARAYARSEDEGMAVFRRCLDGLVVAVVPITVLISAGSDVFIHVAFGEKYAPARLGLSILSLVFGMTYTNMVCANALIVMRRGWSVTAISVGAVFVTAALMLVLVPLGRRVVGVGGECAGAAAAVIGSEACVLIAMISRFPKFPLDAANVRTLSKSVALGVSILLIDRVLRGLGAARLAVDAALLVGIALAIRLVRLSDIARIVQVLRPGRSGNATPPAPSGPGA
jgi:O-antigen/teichoic acid export membrane protein